MKKKFYAARAKIWKAIRAHATLLTNIDTLFARLVEKRKREKKTAYATNRTRGPKIKNHGKSIETGTGESN